MFFFFTREQFVPYLNNSFEILSKLLDEDDEDTMDSALEAYGQLCISFSKLSSTSQECKFIYY